MKRGVPSGTWLGLVVLVGALSAPAEADERRTDLSLLLGTARLSEFEETEPGLGLRLSRRFTGWLAADAELGFQPGRMGEPGFSSSRSEGRLGLRIGPRLGRTGGYAAVRPGLVHFEGSPEPLACIAIFPPPLSCIVAEGETVFALGLAAGFETFPGDRAVIRFELGDDVVRYPGPTFARDELVLDDGFWSHNLRVSLGVGWRF